MIKNKIQIFFKILISIFLILNLLSCHKRITNYEDSKVYEIDKKLIILGANSREAERQFDNCNRASTSYSYYIKKRDSLRSKISRISYEMEFYINQKKNLFKEL